MKVEAVFYPPFVGGGVLTSGEIIKDLQYLGVKHGIDNQIIEQILSHREYGEAYKIAVGTQPRDGSDGYIEYKFNTELKPRPKMNDDGTVDFIHLRILIMLTKVMLLLYFIKKTGEMTE